MRLFYSHLDCIMQGNKRELSALCHILLEGHVSHKLKMKKIMRLPRRKTYCTYKLLCASYSTHRSHNIHDIS